MSNWIRERLTELQALEEKLRAGGGAAKVEKQHRDGKMTARERVAALLDPEAFSFEVGLLVANLRMEPVIIATRYTRESDRQGCSRSGDRWWVVDTVGLVKLRCA